MTDNHELLILANPDKSSIVLSGAISNLAARGREDALRLAKRKSNVDSSSATEEAELDYSLGVLCYEGLKLPKDYSKSVLFFGKAAEKGHVRAQCCLGMMYAAGLGVPQDHTEAAIWLKRAA